LFLYFFVLDGWIVNVVDGEILSITKVSRLHMAAYLCVASNGVPPSISKVNENELKLR
jgi:neurotrimin